MEEPVAGSEAGKMGVHSIVNGRSEMQKSQKFTKGFQRWVGDKACSAYAGMNSHADGTALGEICKCKKTGSLAAWWQVIGLTRENGPAL